MLNLYLVRHGETDANRNGLFQGASNAPLNASGLRQAVALGLRLKRESISAVYSSPQARALETAQPIAVAQGLRVVPVDGLRELDIGELDGLDGQELSRRFPGFLDQWRKNVGSLRMPGGETIIELQARTWKAVEEILGRHADGNIVAVSHNFAIQSILCRSLGLELTSFRRLRQELAAISVVSFRDGEPMLTVLNDRCHLEGIP